jgi:hypothetical protein
VAKKLLNNPNFLQAISEKLKAAWEIWKKRDVGKRGFRRDKSDNWWTAFRFFCKNYGNRKYE